MTRPVAVLILLGCVVGTTGCGGGSKDGPPIPDSLLVDVLVDVYSATARAHLESLNADSARAEAVARFGLDTADLTRTLNYFAENPDSASKFYQGALDSLVRIQRELRSRPEADSLALHLRG